MPFDPYRRGRGRCALEYEVGSRIVYPLHGAGVIEAIEQRDVLGHSDEYYVVRLIVGDIRALIPVSRAASAGIRPVEPRARIEEALRDARDVKESPVGYGDRFRANNAKLRAGDVDSVSEVVGSLSQRRRQRGLSAGEARLFEQAWQILLSELVLSAQILPEHADAFLRDAVG